MSALPPKADIGGRDRDVRFVPKADIMHRSKSTAIQTHHRRGRTAAEISAAIKPYSMAVMADNLGLSAEMTGDPMFFATLLKDWRLAGAKWQLADRTPAVERTA